ncbi:MAG: hypothetical protein E8D46_13035 [Nitrospira sp.]|nr:MAG: hypothetical protein E8D46_13035 [Nitrospira sp.]
MAAFATLSASEARCKAQIVAKVWVTAHAGRNATGAIIARFQRYMSPTQRGEGAWIETTDDSVN